VKAEEINSKIQLAGVYKYILQLEMEKSKRKNGVYHDASDIETHYSEKIKNYEETIKELCEIKAKKARSTILFAVTAVQALALLAFLCRILVK
jgi:hypothetical protein